MRLLSGTEVFHRNPRRHLDPRQIACALAVRLTALLQRSNHFHLLSDAPRQLLLVITGDAVRRTLGELLGRAISGGADRRSGRSSSATIDLREGEHELVTRSCAGTQRATAPFISRSPVVLFPLDATDNSDFLALGLPCGGI